MLVKAVITNERGDKMTYGFTDFGETKIDVPEYTIPEELA